MQQPFVLGEFADKAQDQQRISETGGPDDDHASARSDSARRREALDSKAIASHPRAWAAATVAAVSWMKRIASGGSPSPASTAAKAASDGLVAFSSQDRNNGSSRAPSGIIRRTKAGLSLKPPTINRWARPAAIAQASRFGASNTLSANSHASLGS